MMTNELVVMTKDTCGRVQNAHSRGVALRTTYKGVDDALSNTVRFLRLNDPSIFTSPLSTDSNAVHLYVQGGTAWLQVCNVLHLFS